MTLADTLIKQFSLLQHAEFFLRILIACGCGSIIGLERSKRLKEAGVRTHVIVCCASAMLMIVSKYAFADTVGASGEALFGTDGADPARLAAQIITGISFLGMGVIFRKDNSIRGLTTAAGIWAVAGIGIAIGAGMYVIGVFTTAVIAVAQILMHRFTIGVDSTTLGKMHCVANNSAEIRNAMNAYIEEHKLQIVDVHIEIREDGRAVYEVILRVGNDMSINSLSEFLESVDGVVSASFELYG